MKSRSILGTFESKHIKLGAGRIFIGSPGATFDGTAKFDTNAPGADWEDMGAIAQDVGINCSADLLRYTNGLPAVLKKVFVTGRQATLSATFDEFKARAIQVALGLETPFNHTSGTNKVVQAGSTASIIILNNVTALTEGDEVIAATDVLNLPSTHNSGLILSIDTGTSTITLRQPLPGGVPDTGAFLVKRTSSHLIFGGTDLRIYPLLFVVDFAVDNKQFVVFCPNVSSLGSFNPNISGGNDIARIGVTWDLHAEYDSDIDDNGIAQFYPFESEVA